MPTVTTVGGKSIVIPALEMDIADLEADEEKVYANWRELHAAYAMAARRDDADIVDGYDGNNGTVLLPAGTIYASTPPGEARLGLLELDERHAGITVQGAGREKTLLIDPYTTLQVIQIASRRISYLTTGPFEADTDHVTPVNPQLCQEGHLLYFWNIDLDEGRSPQQRVRIIPPIGGDAYFTPALSQTWGHFRHFAGYAVNVDLPVGATSAPVSSTFESQFNLNDDIAVSDGVFVSESNVEFVRVTNKTTSGSVTTIEFTPSLRRNYESDVACLLPAPHMGDITIRDLSVAGPNGNEPDRYMGFMIFGVRMRLDNVGFVADGTDAPLAKSQFNVASCGATTIAHFRSRGYLVFNTSHDTVLNDVAATIVQFEEACFDAFCSDVITNGYGFQALGTGNVGPCQRIHLTDCLIINHGASSALGDTSGFSVCEGSCLNNVTLMLPNNAEPIYLNSSDYSLNNVTTQSDLRIRGANVRLVNVDAPNIILETVSPYGPSSGVLIMPPALHPTKVQDNAAAGNWLRPLYVARDGKAIAPLSDTTGGATPPGLILPSPAAAKVPLTIVAHGSQSVDLQQWQNASGKVLFAIRSDGSLRTDAVKSGAPTVAANRKLEVYDADGNLTGYIAVHPTS